MYESHWGLTEKPFQNTLDSRFFYYTPQHKDAIMKLNYCIQDGMGAGLLTGVFGCGKTFIAQTIINQLNPARFKIVFISHPPATSIDLLISICSELGDREILSKAKESSFAESIVWDSLKTQISNNHLNGKDTLIIIDEAHIINDANIFETIRLLLNLQAKNKFLITLILIGQPELAEKIENIKPLEQRIAVKSSIGHLTEGETENYIAHRLKVAGRLEPIFTKETIGFIYESTGGIPRRINRLCDLALLSGFMHQANKIDVGILQAQAMGIEYKTTAAKNEEATINAGLIFSPPAPKVEEKDAKQTYNHGLILVENLLSRVEKKEALDIKLIASFVSQIIEMLKLKDVTLFNLAYKTNTSDYLYNHSLGICIFSLAIGLEIGVAEAALIDLGLAAILHDLGMVNLRQVIQQPRRLNPEEFEAVKSHPVLTIEILTGLKDVNEAVRSSILAHHERINGQGYPKGLKKEEITLEAKVLAVADVWEALTHARPWRERFIPYEAMLMMRDFSESLLDSAMVKVLVDKLSIYPIGSSVKLNTGETAEVISAERGFPSSLKILSDAGGRNLAEPKLTELSSYPNLYIDRPLP